MRCKTQSKFRSVGLRKLRTPMVAGAVIAVGLFLAPPEARAQFICAPGGGATATDASGVACGTDATATGADSTAVGYSAGELADGSSFGNSAFGRSAGQFVTGNRNTASGVASGFAVTGDFNSAFGTGSGAFVAGSRNSAFGVDAGRSVDGSNNVAIGINAGSGTLGNQLVVSNTVAIGNSAVARADGAVAIGNGAQATHTNQFAFGTTANTYTMAGIDSAASRAAQTGPTQLVTSDSGGNLATASLASLGVASTADLGTINSQLGAINARLDDLNGRTSKAITGVAMAFAMAGVPTLMPHERFAATMNWGTYQGANGLAVNTAFRITNNVQLNGGIAYGADERTAGGRVGLRVGW
jgi:hypothetical protein